MKREYWKAREYPAKNADQVMFFFPAGFTKLWMYRFTFWRLNKMNITVVGFDFSWRKAARELEFSDLVNIFGQVNKYVEKKISNSQQVKYSIFGTSFGGVFSMYVAKRNKQISAIILNVTHGKSSNLLWDYKPTKPVIDKLKDSGVDSEEKFEAVTEPIESSKDIELLSNRKVVSFVSLNDRVTKDNFRTIESLRKVNPSTIVYTTKLGHHLGAAKNILSKSKWDVVLK